MFSVQAAVLDLWDEPAAAKTTLVGCCQPRFGSCPCAVDRVAVTYRREIAAKSGRQAMSMEKNLAIPYTKFCWGGLRADLIFLQPLLQRLLSSVSPRQGGAVPFSAGAPTDWGRLRHVIPLRRCFAAMVSPFLRVPSCEIWEA